MATKKTTNTLTSGLNLSSDPINQAKDSYSFGLNGVKENIINNPELVTNEKGFTEYINLGYEYILLGTRYLSKKEYVFFIKNKEATTVFNKILLVRDGAVVKTILDRTDLNFDSSHPIMSTYRINYKGQRIVYWVDGLNDDRIINIDIDSTSYDISLFSINSSATKPILEATVIDNGGTLVSGQYFISISYNLGDSYTTEPLLISKPISIASEDYSNNKTIDNVLTKSFGQTDGDIIPSPTRKSIQINTSELDTNFDSYNLIILRQEETFNIVRVISKISFTQDEYVFTGSEGEINDTLSLNDIITSSVNYYASEAIIQKDNRLLRGNSKLKASAINYQSYANNIVVNYKINEELVYNLDVKNGYKTDNKGDGGFISNSDFLETHGISPSYLANTANNDTDNKSLMRDEVYSLGIGFELIDGSETDVYHISGRPIDYFAVTPTGTGEYNRTFTPSWDSDLVDGEPRWKTRNTAVKQSTGELAYWRSTEVYPDGYGFPTNGEVDEDGKSYIRHHKMPSDVLEPIYRTEIIGNPNKYRGETTNYKIYKRNIGLDFSNIVIPTELQDKIKKIKFYFTPRDSSNKSILSKGLIYSLNTTATPNEQPNYFNYENTGAIDSINTFEFISPETNFNFKQDNLSGTTVKICGIDKGYVQFAGAKEDKPNESGNNAYYIRTYNNKLFEENGRQQSIISAFCFYNQRTIPKEDNYSRELDKLIYVDDNYSGTTDIANLNFLGSQDTAILKLMSPISFKPSVVAIPLANYYPELLYPSSSDKSSQLFRGVLLSVPEDSYIGPTYNTIRRFVESKSWADNLYYDTSFYVQISNSKSNLYGSINNLKFIELGTAINYNIGDTVTASVRGGDTFIDVHHFKQSKIVPQSRQGEEVPIVLNVEGNYSTTGITENNLLTEIFEAATQSYGSFFCETDINIRMRREGLTEDEKYFPKSFYNISKLRDISKNIDNKEFYKIDTSYKTQYLKPYFAFYTDLDTISKNSNEDIRYFTRIIYSDKQSLEDKTDNYRKVRANNYRDLPLDKGGITIFFINQEKLYAITRDTLFNVYTSNQSLKGLSDSTITVGTGEFLGTEPIDLLSIDGGFSGTSSKLSFVESPYGYLFVDRYKGKIILFNNETNDIAIKDISEFIKDNFDIKAIENLGIEDNAFDNPLNNYGYVCGFDAELNRFLITKLDYKLSLENIANYKGIFDPTYNYNNGDIYFKDGKLLYVFQSSSDGYSTLVETSDLSDFIPSDVAPLEFTYTTPSHGSIVNNLNGTITFNPTTDYSGEDSFNISSNCLIESINTSILYGNTVQEQIFIKNNCSSGDGTEVNYIVPANRYYASSLEAANDLADADIAANGQNYANTNGFCAFKNVEKSGTAIKVGCPEGEVGTTVTYTVDADTYTSYISQADADNQAQLDVDLNKQQNANDNGTCIVGELFGNTVRTGTATKDNCEVGIGSTETLTVDADTYFSYDSVEDANDIADVYILANKQEYANTHGTCSTSEPVGNDYKSQAFQRTTCVEGNVGTFVNRIVPANTYFAATKIEANALAQAFIDSTGQANANAVGLCLPPNTFTLQVVIYGDYTNAKYDASDSRGLSFRFSYAGVIKSNYLVSSTVNRDNTIYTFTVPFSGSSVELSTLKGYLTLNGASTSDSVTERLYINNLYRGASTHSLTAGQPSGTKYEINIIPPDYNIILPGDTVRIEHGTPPIPIYYNTLRTGTATRNDCGSGYTGSTVTLTVAAGTPAFNSLISVADANAMADAYIAANKQAYANSTGTCTLIPTYGNTLRTGTAVKSTCGSGFTGSTVTYPIPANTYFSTISIADANAMADADIVANKQAYADANGTCTAISSNIYLSGQNSASSNIIFNNITGSVLSGTHTVGASFGATSSEVTASIPSSSITTVLRANLTFSGSYKAYYYVKTYVNSILVDTNSFENFTPSLSITVSSHSLTFNANDHIKLVVTEQAYSELGFFSQEGFSTSGIACGFGVTDTTLYSSNPTGAFNIGDIALYADASLYPKLIPFLTISPDNYITYDNGGVSYWAQLNPTTGAVISKGACTAPTTYYSAPITVSAIKNNCDEGEAGSSVPLNLILGFVTDTTSQIDVDTRAADYANANKQSNANEFGTCTPICTLAITTSKTDETLVGANDGTITVTATGGVGTLQFSKDNGTTWITGTSPYIFTGLPPSLYNIKARNSDGSCITPTISVSINAAVAPSCDLAISFVSKTDESMSGVSDGSITVNGTTSNSGGFLLSKNGGASYPFVGTSPFTFTGLSAGTYAIAAINSDGSCETSLPSPVVINTIVPTNAVGIIVVDVLTTPSLEICGFISGTGFPYNTPVYKNGSNFLPNDGTPAANCWALASDLNTGFGQKYRFEFNVKKLLITYPSETQFIFKIRGRNSSSGTASIRYDLKGATSGNMTMTGSPGTYIPSVDTPNNLGAVTLNKSYTGGADGNIGLAYGSDILTLTYNVAAKTVTAS